MRAAVAYEVGGPLVVEEVDPSPVGTRDVFVRIAASGICHTDLTVINGLSSLPLPIVPGHEACGVEEEVGAEVRRVRVGDRVLASVSPALRQLLVVPAVDVQPLRAGYPQGARAPPAAGLPDGRRVPSVCGCGTFADAMVVDEASVVAVETDLADDELALLGCGVTTGLGAVLNTAGRRARASSVAVIGCGAVGQSVLQGARLAGAVHDRGRRPGAGAPRGRPRARRHPRGRPADGDPVEQVGR